MHKQCVPGHLLSYMYIGPGNEAMMEQTMHNLHHVVIEEQPCVACKPWFSK